MSNHGPATFSDRDNVSSILYLDKSMLPKASDIITIGEERGLLVEAVSSNKATPGSMELRRLSQCIQLPSSVPVVSLAWHPKQEVLAVTTERESAHFFDLSTEAWLPLILRHPLDSSISHIAFNPQCPTMIATVGIDTVFLWEACSLNKLNAQVSWLKAPDICSEVHFSPCGRFLAAASSTELFIWDLFSLSAGLDSPLVIKTEFYAFCSAIKWSPSSSYIVVGSDLASKFMIVETAQWNTAFWHLDHSSHASGLIDASWLSDPSADVLITFASSAVHICATAFPKRESALSSGSKPSSMLYSNDVISLKVLNQEEHQYGEGEDVTTLGTPQQICCSPDGKRLCVSFTDHNKHLIAVFSCYVKTRGTVPEFNPIGFIKGPRKAGLQEGRMDPAASNFNEAIYMSFHPTFDEGSLLSVIWEDNRVITYPFLYQ